jgi:hypothetical protein
MTIRINDNGSSLIKQFTVDPSYPVSDKTKVRSRNLWILYTPAGAGATTAGMPMGLLMALTYAETSAAGAAAKYELSVNTTSGIKRVEIP